jgi:phosphotriesterase-related protein
MTTRREFLMRTMVAGVLGAASFGAAQASKDRPRKSAHAGVVETVLGPLEVSKLGFTLSHEHVCCWPHELYSDRASAVTQMVDKLKEARDGGIDTIIDVTTFDVGRDVRFGEEVSRKSGMQIVASTGQHFFAPESLNERTVEQIAELFVREIERGIEDTDIKAGVIKVAARSHDMTPAEEKVFRAAARASKATGAPIATHTNARRRSGEKQAELFEAEGISPARVSLGHSDDSDDVNYLIGLAKRGYTLGIDHAFYGNIQGAEVSWQKRAEYIKQLIGAGFGDRLFLSNDWELDREKINPDGFLFNTRKTIPYLKQIGVSQRQIHAITVENPKRFFSRLMSMA